MNDKIIIGADPLGLALKISIQGYLNEKGYETVDVGTFDACSEVAYYDVGFRVGKAISSKAFSRGIIFFGSGMGVNIVANKFPGVYCGLAESMEAATWCRIINNCNVLALGGRITAEYKARKLVDAFLHTEFSSPNSGIDPDFLIESFQKLEILQSEIAPSWKNY